MTHLNFSFVLAINCDANPCGENAICKDTETSFTCSCSPGFAGDGFNCQGIISFILSAVGS